MELQIRHKRIAKPKDIFTKLPMPLSLTSDILNMRLMATIVNATRYNHVALRPIKKQAKQIQNK